MKTWLVIVLFAGFLCGPQIHAEEDHEIARRAVERGELLPLAKILSSVERTHPGRVLEVELEREKGRYFYEIEVLLPDGRVVELTYDGKSGELLESEVEDD